MNPVLQRYVGQRADSGVFAREVSATTLSYRLNTIGRLYLCPSAALRPPFSSILNIVARRTVIIVEDRKPFRLCLGAREASRR